MRFVFIEPDMQAPKRQVMTRQHQSLLRQWPELLITLQKRSQRIPVRLIGWKDNRRCDLWKDLISSDQDSVLSAIKTGMFAGMPEGNQDPPVPAADFNLVSIRDDAIRRRHARIQMMRLEDVFSDLFDLAVGTPSFFEIAGNKPKLTEY